ncbi:MAG: alpha-galactosidase [Clostridia bacterium]|nr:alpha-galactosidase [Clostridia bacterium]
MIKIQNGYAKIDTPNNSLVLSLKDDPKLVYIGSKIADCDDYSFSGESIFQIFTSADDADSFRRLVSSSGDGHARESMIYLCDEDGNSTVRLRFEKCEERKAKPELVGMPSSYGESECLSLYYSDKCFGVFVEQYFAFFPDNDVVATGLKIRNASGKKIKIKRAMSLQLDLSDGDYEVLTLDGAAGRERRAVRRSLKSGTFSNASFSGLSSNSRNPFIEITKKGYNGFTVAANLVYSGNHKEIFDLPPLGGARLLSGINDYLLDFVLESGEEFDTPEAVFTVAENEEKASFSMRRFVGAHIIPKRFVKAERPILINSWESFLFNFDRKKLIEMCKKAAGLGIEMFVLDDGWFGKRDNDLSSLGDWTENEPKLGGTLGGLADEVRRLGLRFGIWVEPEMISRDSDLYRAHPEYAMTINGVEPIEIRHQIVLDITKEEVRENILKQLFSVIEKSKADYLKWDCNRGISELKNSGELFHKYVLGVYDMLKKLTARFPDLLIESCASGGNRFDLGMLCFTPQIWASDDADPRERTTIQEGTAKAYPPLTMGAHVAHIPNWHTFNGTSYDNAFAVASSGAFGYEFDITKLSKEDDEILKRQVDFYKKWRKVLQFGDYIVNENSEERGISSYTLVDDEKEKAIATVIYLDRTINKLYPVVYIKGLDGNGRYNVSFRGGERSPFTASGSALEKVGVYLGNLYTDKRVSNNYNSIQTVIMEIEKI